VPPRTDRGGASRRCAGRNMQHDTLHAPCGVQQSATWHAAGGAGEPKRRRRSVTASGRPRRAGACCNSAQHGCATTQPTAFAIRCNGASPVATALRTTTQQPLATQCSLPWRNRTCCSAAQRVAMQRDPLQPTTACCNLSQRCSQYSVCRSNPARCNAAQPVATDHSSLPWATARCNLLQRSQRSAVHSDRPQPVAIDHSLLQPVAAMSATQCDPLQQTSSATGCNAVPSAGNRAQPVGWCVMRCVAHPGCEWLESVCKSRSPLQRSHHGLYERWLPSTRWGTRSTHTCVLPSDDTTTTACTSGGSRACRPVDLLH
jgi:hypothetical protein